MSRISIGRLTRAFPKPPKSTGSGQHVARLFVPAYDRGITINVTVHRNRNSDARRRLGRMFEPRRVVS